MRSLTEAMLRLDVKVAAGGGGPVVAEALPVPQEAPAKEGREGGAVEEGDGGVDAEEEEEEEEKCAIASCR